MRAVFFGLGADGTVGANKNSIKIIGEETDNYAQGYFVYDSKKSGAITISHLRFGPGPIRSAYLIRQRQLRRLPPVRLPREATTCSSTPRRARVFLLNAPYAPDEVWDHLPREVQEQIVEKKLKLLRHRRLRGGATRPAWAGASTRSCRPASSPSPGVLPREEAIAQIKKAIEKTYGKKGAEVVRAELRGGRRRRSRTCTRCRCPARRPRTAQPAAARRRRGARLRASACTAVMMAGKGDLLPVSAFPVDGTWPTGTAQWEKRAIAARDPGLGPDDLHPVQQVRAGLPARGHPRQGLRPRRRWRSAPGHLQVDRLQGPRVQGAEVHDPGGARGLHRLQPVRRWSARPRTRRTRGTRRSTWRRSAPLREAERDELRLLPRPARAGPQRGQRSTSRARSSSQPLFEYSGACAGCGETPYLKLLTQLFGDRAADRQRHRLLVDLRRQPADHALHREPRRPRPGLVQLALRGQRRVRPRHAPRASTATSAQARELLAAARRRSSATAWCRRILEADQTSEAGHRRAARARGGAARSSSAGIAGPEARRLELLADYLVKKSVWIVGGDGWAYDIGFGGLDHVLSHAAATSTSWCSTPRSTPTPAARQSKATPLGAAAKFAAAGKEVAQEGPGPDGDELRPRLRRPGRLRRQGRADGAGVPGGREPTTGPSLIIAYSHCIAHGYDMAYGAEQQKLAVDSGVWPLYRFDPRRVAAGRAAAQARLRRRRRSRVARLHAQRDALPHGREARPGALQAAARRGGAARPRAALRRLRAARRHHRPAGPDAEAEARTGPGREEEEPHGPLHDLPRPQAAAPADARGLAAGRRPRHREAARGRRAPPAIVMHSLFEEQIAPRAGGDLRPHRDRTASPSPRRSPTSRAPTRFALGPDEYLEQLRARQGRRCAVPVIASLNGTTPGGWLDYARLIEQAGRRRAGAQRLPRSRTDPRGERRRRSRSARVRDGAGGASGGAHPGGGEALALLHRRSPTSRARLDEAGADGLVLFNRFYQPDIDVEELEVRRAAAPLRLVGAAAAAALAGHPLRPGQGLARRHAAASTPRSTSIKAIMAGAHAVQMVSALLQHGPELPRHAAPGARAVAARSTSTTRCAQMQGSMSLERCPDPRVYERANYMLMLQGWRAGD